MSEACNIVETIREETVAVRAHTALVDGALTVSYGQLLAAVDSVAEALVRAGVQPRMRVAFLCADCADYVVGCLAILRSGAVAVPVSPSFMGDELETLLERMDVHFLVADASVARGAAGTPLGRCGFVAREFTLRRRQARDDLPPDYAALNPAFIRFSSGTTGTSKGVLLSHETLLARTDAADQGLRITSADTVIWVLSMSFHFVVTILLYLRRGATVTICRQPFPESFLDAARGHSGTVFYATPFHYHVLATSPRVPLQCLAGLRLAVSVATKLGDETAAAFAAKFGFGLVEAYGIIEVGLPFIDSSAGPRKRGSVGRAQPGYAIQIADPDGQGVGAIRLRGPGMFDAYISPWQRWADLAPDGWFNTGDVGRLDDAGELFILGRVKNVINFTGMKIFPEEVEAVLGMHPAVADCQVHGVAHPLWGQLPCARIVVRPGMAAPTVNDLRRFCFQRLTSHKVPKEYEFLERLDRTASGKLRRG